MRAARRLFRANGYAGTEMEDIRRACELSRGGLYHHFGSKASILDALVDEEIGELAERLERSDGSPIETLLEAGSSHLGAEPGIVTALRTVDEKRLYLGSLDRAFARDLSPLLGEKLADAVRPGIDPADVAELLLTVNAHLNRRAVLGEWDDARAARFAATALEALTPLVENASRLRRIIRELRKRGTER